MLNRDLTGETFTRLKVLGPGPINSYGKRQWWCECQCKDKTKILVTEAHLLNGNTKSCGCLQRESVINRNMKHGYSKHPLYGVYKAMKQRGIEVCDEWLGDNGAANFITWAEKNGYEKGMRVYRKDTDKGFCPDNVEFRIVKNPHPEITPRQSKTDDMIGRKFGHLTVIAFAGSRRRRDGEKYREWVCECDCPEHNRIVVKTDNLTSLKVTDCGCMNKRRIFARQYNMDTTEGILKNSPEYQALSVPDQYKVYKRIGDILRKMKQRCYDKDSHAYNRYGGKGVEICDEWNNEYTGLGNFICWSLQNGYRDDLSIDRLDSNGDYCPKNCRWATDLEQANNKTNNHWIYDGKEWLTMAEFERKYNRVAGYFITRYDRGWSVDAIVHDAKETSKDIRHVGGQYYCEGFIELIPRIKENHLSDNEKYKAAMKFRHNEKK